MKPRAYVIKPATVCGIAGWECEIDVQMEPTDEEAMEDFPREVIEELARRLNAQVREEAGGPRYQSAESALADTIPVAAAEAVGIEVRDEAGTLRESLSIVEVRRRWVEMKARKPRRGR